MTTISNSNNRILDETNPIIDMNPACSHHAISIEGATGDVTLKIKPRGMTALRPFSDNVITENSGGVFMLGSIEQLEITPANAVPYVVSVSSF